MNCKESGREALIFFFLEEEEVEVEGFGTISFDTVVIYVCYHMHKVTAGHTWL